MRECPQCGRCLRDEVLLCPDDASALHRVFDGPCALDRKYQLIVRLGAGGMGAVYKARHLGLQKDVAVKVLPGTLGADPRFVAQFGLEARTLARLDHPAVVRIIDFGCDAERGTPYLAMDYLEGTSLAQYVERHGPLPTGTALAILDQVAAGLDHAHDRGILHRDLKASNVLLLRAEAIPGGAAATPGTTREAGPAAAPEVKVVDFGLACFVVDPEATPEMAEGQAAPGTMAARAASPDAAAITTGAGTSAGSAGSTSAPRSGTPLYMAPELWERQAASPASDLWAFGVLAYLVLAGRHPFAGPSLAAIRDQVRAGPQPPDRLNPALDAALAPAILAPLRPDPAARPRRARQVVEQLRRAVAAVERRRFRAREAPRRAALAALLALLAPIGAQSLSAVLRSLENRLVDARFALAAPRLPRPDLALIVLDDATLERDPMPLAERADEVGGQLQRVFASGARGVGIDLLLPRVWSRSEAFSNLVLRHAGAMVLAAYSGAGSRVIGPEAIQGMTTAALGPERAAELFGFVDVAEDRDGVVRRAWPLYHDAEGRLRHSFAGGAARIWARGGGATGDRALWIDGSIDPRGFERVSFRHLDQVLEREPHHFQDRFVLLGGDFAAAGDNLYHVPHPHGLPDPIPGIVLQALVLQTLIDGAPIRQPGLAWTWAAISVAAGVAAAAILLASRPLAVAAAPLAGGVWLAAAFLLFTAARELVPIAAPAGALLLVAIAAAVLRRKLPAVPPDRWSMP
jgi:serine/threonine protein kinase/CHASE2 domain-containing sensor protein